MDKYTRTKEKLTITMPIMINTRITILSIYCLPEPKTNLTYTTRCADFFQSGGLPGIQPLKRSPGSNVHFILIPGTSNVFSRLERERRWAPWWARTPLATLTTSCQLNLRHRLQNEVWNKWWNKNKKSFHKDLKNTYVCFLQLGKRMPTRWYDTAETNRKEVVTVVSLPDFRIWWFCFLLLYRCK